MRDASAPRASHSSRGGCKGWALLHVHRTRSARTPGSGACCKEFSSCPASPSPQFLVYRRDMPRPTLSLVILIFNEEAVIPELDRRLKTVLAASADLVDSWEVVFINDGSRDDSLSQLRKMAEAEPRYKVLSFARNFGHQMAITAGIDRAEGAAVVVMDADLQDPPEVVREMITLWRQGFDVVYGVRRKRAGETIFKKLTAAAFYRLLRAMLGGISIPADAGDFRLMSRPVVLAMRALKERHRFVRGMV